MTDANMRGLDFPARTGRWRRGRRSGTGTGDRAQWTAYVLREFAAELGLARTPTR